MILKFIMHLLLPLQINKNTMDLCGNIGLKEFQEIDNGLRVLPLNQHT